MYGEIVGEDIPGNADMGLDQKDQSVGCLYGVLIILTLRPAL